MANLTDSNIVQLENLPELVATSGGGETAYTYIYIRDVSGRISYRVHPSELRNVKAWVSGTIYRYSPSLTTYNNKLYLLNSSATLPFTTSNFATELAAGTWILIGISDELKARLESYPDFPTTPAGEFLADDGTFKEPTINSLDEDKVALINNYSTLGLTTSNTQEDVNSALNQYVADMDGGGFVSWDTPASNKWSITGTTPNAVFNLLQGGYGRILGKLVRFEAQTITSLPTSYALYFVAVNGSGVISLQSSLDKTTHFPLFHLFVGVSGTYYVAVENHAFNFTQAISGYLHETLGTLIIGSGGNVAIGATTTQVAIQGEATFSDHGLSSTIPDSGTAGVTWIQDYKNASGQWALYTLSANLAPYYNLSNTPTALTTGRFGVYRLYATKGDGNASPSNARYVALMHTAEYNTQSAAFTAITQGNIVASDGLLDAVEIAQLGFAIINSYGVVVQAVIAKKMATTTIVGGTSGLAPVAYDGLYTSLTNKLEEIEWACSDEGSALTTGTAKITDRIPFNCTIIGAKITVGTAPTGSTIIVDFNIAGSSIFSTRISIDASEKTSTTAATSYVLSTTSATADQEITIDFDQVGATIAGAGLKFVLYLIRT